MKSEHRLQAAFSKMASRNPARRPRLLVQFLVTGSGGEWKARGSAGWGNPQMTHPVRSMGQKGGSGQGIKAHTLGVGFIPLHQSEGHEAEVRLPPSFSNRRSILVPSLPPLHKRLQPPGD